MEARSLVLVVAALLVLWVVRISLKRSRQERQAHQSRLKLRSRAGDHTLVGRLFGRSRAVTRRNVDPAIEQADDPVVNRANWLQAGYSVNTTPSGRLSEQVSSELTELRARLQEREESIRQLQRNLENLVASTGVDINDIEGSTPNNNEARVEIERLQKALTEREHTCQRNRHAMEEVEKVRKQLYERGREMELLKQDYAASQETLANFRSGAQRAALLEQQLASARLEIGKLREQEAQREMEGPNTEFSKNAAELGGRSDRVSGQSSELNQMKKFQLVGELNQAEAEAEESQQNSLELRRLRSELESVRSDCSTAKNRIAELQIRIREQQKALEKARSHERPSAEISVLKQSLAERQRQNEELKERLSQLISESQNDELKELNSALSNA